jgi:hypothetical protein
MKIVLKICEQNCIKIAAQIKTIFSVSPTRLGESYSNQHVLFPHRKTFQQKKIQKIKSFSILVFIQKKN